MILAFLAIITGCKKWDPNIQYSTEMSSKKILYQKQNGLSQQYSLSDLKLGQPLSEVLGIAGRNYNILARITSNGTHWLKIELLNNPDNLTSPSGRTELTFKNNFLLKISKI